MSPRRTPRTLDNRRLTLAVRSLLGAVLAVGTVIVLAAPANGQTTSTTGGSTNSKTTGGSTGGKTGSTGSTTGNKTGSTGSTTGNKTGSTGSTGGTSNRTAGSTGNTGSTSGTSQNTALTDFEAFVADLEKTFNLQFQNEEEFLQFLMFAWDIFVELDRQALQGSSGRGTGGNRMLGASGRGRRRLVRDNDGDGD
jgi:hypothetical protein